MKKNIVNIIYSIVHYFGILKLFRFINRNNVSIILYHNPTAEVFENHIKYLIKHYNIISLSEFVSNAIAKNKFGTTKNCLILTIDDGHKNNFHLLPIIKKYKITPTIYLSSQIICRNRKFWWSVVKSNKEIDNLKMLANKDKINYLLKEYDFSLDDEFEFNERDAMCENEILEMNSYVDFQAHTCYHPILTQCSDDELFFELYESKQMLESLLKKEIHHFSYPNGDYDNRVMSMVKSLGYLSARSTDCGWVNNQSNLFKLKIVGVSDKGSLHRFKLDLLGLPLLFVNWNRRFQFILKKTINKLKIILTTSVK